MKFKKGDRVKVYGIIVSTDYHEYYSANGVQAFEITSPCTASGYVELVGTELTDVSRYMAHVKQIRRLVPRKKSGAV